MGRAYKVARAAHRIEPWADFDVTWLEDIDGKEAELTERFEVFGEVSGLMISELARNADMESDDPAAMALVAEFFVDAFGDSPEGRSGYQRFLRVRRRCKMPDEQLMEIMGDLAADYVARPTEAPSPSERGRSTTGATSRVSSSTGGGSRDFVVIEGDLEQLAALSS